jgi:PKD repeat protein
MKKIAILRFGLLLLLYCVIAMQAGAQTGSCCSHCCANRMTINGDFSAPCFNGSYQSDIAASYRNCNNIGSLSNAFTDGGFTEAANAADWNNNAWVGTEHTGNGGRALLIDGPVNNSKRVWYQPANVVKGRSYCFTAWLLNICPGCSLRPSFIVKIGTTQIARLDQLSAANGWTRVCVRFTATASSLSTLAIIMLPSSQQGVFTNAGNDAMIDDISFCEIEKPDASFTFPTPECNKPLQFTAAPANGTHQWIFSNGFVSTQANPVFNFAGLPPGLLTVKHIVTGPCDSDSSEQTIYIPDCRPCCGPAIELDAVGMSMAQPSLFSCCFDIYLKKSDCAVYGAVTTVGDGGGIALSSDKIVPGAKIGRYCLQKGEKRTITVYFLGRLGDTVCIKQVPLYCPDDCCYLLDIRLQKQEVISSADCACMFRVVAGLPPGSDCSYHSFVIENTGNEGILTTYPHSFPLNLQGNTLVLGDLCVLFRMGAAGGGGRVPVKLRVKFFDADGNLLCSRELADSCSAGIGIIPDDGVSRHTNGIIGLKSRSKAVAEAAAPTTLTLFPNPAKTKLRVQLPGNTKTAGGNILIADGSGRVVKQLTVNIPSDGFSIDIAELKPGAYFMVYTDSNGRKLKAGFVKE